MDPKEAPKRYRIMLVDDHEVVRQGVRTLLDSQPDLAVVAEAATAREAVLRAKAARPDVIVMDVSLPDGNGIEATRQIRTDLPMTQVIMLTTYADEEALFASILAGAAGYVLKEIRGGDLAQAIRTVAEGKGLLDPALTKAVLGRLRSAKDALKDEKLARLTPHEERILALVADGLTNREIADDLHLAEKTIKNYISSILGKLEVGRRAEAAAYLARHTRQGS